MEVLTINVARAPESVAIGNARENIASEIVLDYSAWVKRFGEGTCYLHVQRPQDEEAYEATLTYDESGTRVIWHPTREDTAFTGRGHAQFVFKFGEVEARSVTFYITSGVSLDATGDPPAPWETWMDALENLADETTLNAREARSAANAAGTSATGAQQSATAAESAKTAAVAAAGAAAASASHYPQIVGGVWYVWSPTAGEYISTGIDAQGEDGVSPTVEITAIQGGHRVVITDAAGPHTFDVTDGVTPDMSAYRTAAEQDVIDDAQDEELNNLKSALDTKAGILRDTASGSVASFVPDSTVPNLLGLDVALEPIQDLHGYDSPWPAGGNINKLDPTVAYAGLTYNPAVGRVVTPTVSTNKWIDNGDGTFGITLGDWAQAGFVIGPLPSGAVYFSFASATGGLRISVFVMDSEYAVNRVSINRNPITEGAAVEVNTTFSGTDTYLGVYIGGAGQAATISQPYVYTGTDASIRTYYPYENLCPISGRDSVEVEADGVNLWHGQLANNVNVVFDTKPGQTYTVYAQLKGSNGCYLYLQSSDDGFVTTTIVGRIITGTTIRPVTFTAETGKEYALWSNASYVEADKIQIELGSTASEYKPYAGNTYTIQLGDTVYGGTLDVTAGTLTVDRAMVDMGTLNWTCVASDTVFYSAIADKANGAANLRCSCYKTGGNTGYSTPDYTVGYSTNSSLVKRVFVGDPNYTTAADFKATVTGQTLLYDLANPIVIDLDPVAIATIAGQTNNVWADAGDVTVEFAADLKTYIDSKIAAAVAALS